MVMMPAQMPPGEPAGEGVELGGQAQSAGYEICVYVKQDGSLSVASEPIESTDTPGTPAKDIGEALAIALQIFKAGGQMPDAQGESASMHAGFNKVKQVGM